MGSPYNITVINGYYDFIAFGWQDAFNLAMGFSEANPQVHIWDNTESFLDDLIYFSPNGSRPLPTSSVQYSPSASRTPTPTIKNGNTIVKRQGSSVIEAFSTSTGDGFTYVETVFFPWATIETQNPGSGYAATPDAYGESSPPGPTAAPSTAFPGWNLALNQFGCQFDSPDGQYNCTEACTNPQLLWNDVNSASTLQNCMAYPIISTLLNTDELTEDARHVAAEFGISSNSSIAAKVIDTIQNCLSDFCTSTNNSCGPLLNNKTFYRDVTFPLSAQGQVASKYAINGAFVIDFCSQAGGVNPDIGGIGVIVSYLMQASLCILLWVLVRILDSWVNVLIWLRWLPFGRRKAMHKAEDARSHMAKSQSFQRIRAAVVSGLADFQKAQCFFILAIVIAALIGINTDSSLLFSSSSYQALWNNYGLIQLLSLGGILPIAFTQFCLLLVSMNHWYTLSLAVVTSVISWRTLFLATDTRPNPKQLQPPQTVFASCGNSNPSFYCLDPADILFPVSVGPNSTTYPKTVSGTQGYTLITSLLVLGFVVIIKLISDARLIYKHRHAILSTLRGIPRKSRMDTVGSFVRRASDTATRPARRSLGNTRMYRSSRTFLNDKVIPPVRTVSSTTGLGLKVVSTKTVSWAEAADTSFKSLEKDPRYAVGLHLLITLVEASFLFSFAVYFKKLAKLTSSIGSTNAGEWTFGQIVAVTVFVPGVLEIFFASVRGPEHAAQYRLPLPYYVSFDKMLGRAPEPDVEMEKMRSPDPVPVDPFDSTGRSSNVSLFDVSDRKRTVATRLHQSTVAYSGLDGEDLHET